MTPQFKVSVSPESLASIQRLRDYAGLGQAVARATDKANSDVVKAVQQRISGRGVRRGGPSPQGPNIGVDTGALRRSITRSSALVVGGADFVQVFSSVGSNVAFGGESVAYAAVHEFGKVIDHPARSVRLRFVQGRFASEKRYQKRKGKGETFTRRARVGAYKQVIPARPYLRPEVEAAVEGGRYGALLDANIRAWARRGGLN